MRVLDLIWPASRKVVAPTPMTLADNGGYPYLRAWRDLIVPLMHDVMRDPRVDRTMDVDLTATADGLMVYDRNSSRRELLWTVSDLKEGSFKKDARYRLQRFMFKKPEWRVRSGGDTARRNKPKRGKYKRSGATWLG